MPRATGRIPHLRRYEEAWEAINRLIRAGGSWSGYERNVLYFNDGRGRFADVSAPSGTDDIGDGRGVSLFDYDLDGDLDLLITNRTAPQVRLYRNESARGRRRIVFRLEGVRSNRQAVGARVAVTAGRRTQVKEVCAGSGFLSQSTSALVFGLAGEDRAERVEVRWPSGLRQTFKDLEAGYLYRLREGEANPTGVPLRAEEKGGEASPVWAPPREEKPKRVRLIVPLELPPLTLRVSGGATLRLEALRGRPALLNLALPDCANCFGELRAWAGEPHKDSRLRLCVLVPETSELSERFTRAAREAGGEVLLAREQDLLALGILVEQAVRWRRDIEVPLSLLLDRQGRVTVIYRGQTSWSRIEEDARFDAAFAEDARRRLEAALPFPGRFVASVPTRNDFQLAVDYLEAGLLEPAEAAFRRALRRRPDDVEALYNLGLLKLETGALEEAERLFERASTLRPDFADARLNWGVAAARRGDLEPARRRFEEVLALKPDHVEALLNLGSAELERGRPEAAVRCFRRAAELEPGLARARKRLGDALRQLGDLPGARRAYEEAAAAAPKDPEIWSNLAVIVAQSGELEEAERLCGRAIAADPGYAPAYNNDGLIRQALGDLEGAERSFRKAIALAPKSPPPYLNLARLYLREGRIREARRVLENLLAQVPGEANALDLLRRLGRLGR